jgi:hypothetical protein
LASEESLLKAGTTASASAEAVEAEYSFIHMSMGINAVLKISPHRSWSNQQRREMLRLTSYSFPSCRELQSKFPPGNHYCCISEAAHTLLPASAVDAGPLRSSFLAATGAGGGAAHTGITDRTLTAGAWNPPAAKGLGAPLRWYGNAEAGEQ